MEKNGDKMGKVEERGQSEKGDRSRGTEDRKGEKGFYVNTGRVKKEDEQTYVIKTE